MATIQKLGQQRASRVPALRAQIATVQLQHIEGVQEHIGRALPAKHSAHAVEIGDTVRSADHTLAVEDHRADRQRSQGGGDRRELRPPLVTGASFEFSTSGKWLELLKQIAPSVTRTAVLRDPIGVATSQFAAIQNQYQQAASYVDRILRGEKPAELPVQAPTKYATVASNQMPPPA